MIHHVTPDGYIMIGIDDQMVTTARTMAQAVPELNNSIRGIEGRMVGALGELAFAKFTGKPITSTYDYDFMIDGIKFDTKTKDRQSYPRGNYEASAYAKNAQQNYDIYVALSTFRRGSQFRFIYLIGWLTKEEYFDPEIARYRPEGDNDGSNNQEASEACFNVEYRHFHRFIV